MLWKVKIFGPMEVFGEPEATRLLFEHAVQTPYSSAAVRATMDRLPLEINGDITISVKQTPSEAPAH
jgi:hypothetical protein